MYFIHTKYTGRSRTVLLLALVKGCGHVCWFTWQPSQIELKFDIYKLIMSSRSRFGTYLDIDPDLDLV